MIKTGLAKRKSRTYFEQVPLEVVRKVLGVDAVKTDGVGTNNGPVRPASRKAQPYRPARSIAKADSKPKAAGRPR